MPGRRPVPSGCGSLTGHQSLAPSGAGSRVGLGQAASRRRAFCTDGSADFARAKGRARRSTLAGFAAISISSPVAGFRPFRFFVAGLIRTVS
jgi:hypothetical protein